MIVNRLNKQLFRFIPNLGDTVEPTSDLMKQNSRFEWVDAHSRAYANIKIFSEFVQNDHFDVKWSSRVKHDASKKAWNGPGSFTPRRLKTSIVRAENSK